LGLHLEPSWESLYCSQTLTGFW